MPCSLRGPQSRPLYQTINDSFWAIFLPHASAPLAHGSGGAFVHDGRGFRRYALLTTGAAVAALIPDDQRRFLGHFFAADAPCALRAWSPLLFAADVPCALRAWSPLLFAADVPCALRAWSPLLFAADVPCALRAWSPLLFAADVPCALRAWSPLVEAAVAALIPSTKKVKLYGAVGINLP